MAVIDTKELLAQWREERLKQLKQDSRLSIPYRKRLPLVQAVSFLTGVGLGVSSGSSAAGLRYRAENAHRLPTTTTGWYLYHKTKNYQMAWGGLKEGAKMGAKLSFWTAAFFGIEDCIDHCRGSKDFFNTVIASVSVAGGFGLWNGFPITTAARTARTGLAIGVAYGLAQDALGHARGRTPGYVDFVLRFRRGGSTADEVGISQSGMA